MKTIARRILVVSFSTGAVISYAQNTSVTRYLLSTNSIARALHADGLGVQADEIRMLTQATAATENPVVELLGADRMPDGHLRLRLRCQKPNECLPFSVAIDRAKITPTSALKIASAQTITEAQLTLPQPTPDAASPFAFAPVAVAAPIRAGAKLTLLMDDAHMHIHLPVVALDTAHVGSEMRVCTPDHKRTFRATAVDATTVRGIAQ